MQNTSTITVSVIVALIIGGIVGYAMGAHKSSSSASNIATSSSMAMSSSSDMSMSSSGGAASDKAVALGKAMRKLWEDHITYTRLYIVETAAGSAGAKDTATRLLKNQEDIGNAIKPYY